MNKRCFVKTHGRSHSHDVKIGPSKKRRKLRNRMRDVAERDFVKNFGGQFAGY